jgi:PBP1b-binding outer membrane lipoprotein LpoB
MKNTTRSVIVALFCSLFLAACMGPAIDSKEEKAQALTPLKGIVVMPTVVTKSALGSDSRGNFTRAGVAGFVNGLVATELGGKVNVHLMTEGQLDGLLTTSGGNRLAQMRIIAAKQDSDAVLDVTVTRFRERDGSDLAVNSPASAAFEMLLTHVETGRVLWAASFDETQEALSNNLFTLGQARSRGFRWITVEDLVRQGIKERLAECPYLQK